MKKNEFKAELLQVFDSTVEGVPFDKRILLIEKYLIEYEKENETKRDTSNYRKKWEDNDLRIILQDAPTTANCIKYAKLFGRRYGSIEQIYRWASTPDKQVERTRPNDNFIHQVKRIAKEIGWKA